MEHPDERQLKRGISATDVPAKLRALGDALVNEISVPEYIGSLLSLLLDEEILNEPIVALDHAWSIC